MSQENVEIVREAMDAYNLGDKDGWARLMDPGLETFPVPEFPEPGSLIGPDAAWDFYQRFGETMAASKLYETSGFETAELIDAGDRVVACQRTPLHGRRGEVVVELWGVHTFDQGRWVRTQWFWSRDEALKAAGPSE
jgi:ketosteroid isomerase-like protein